MFFELLASAMISPDVELIAQNKTVAQKNKTAVEQQVNIPDCSYKYILPAKNNTGFSNYTQIVDKYSKQAKDTVMEFNRRYVNDGQFLKWVTLPELQLEKNWVKIIWIISIHKQTNLLQEREKWLDRLLF